MNDIKLYTNKISLLIWLTLALVLAAGGGWWAHTRPDEAIIGQGVMALGGLLSLILFIKLLRRRPQITLTVHGIQFHYHTERCDATSKQNILNQFIAWDDIHIIQLNGRQLILQIDDNPPDYERLTEIELANLPPREIVLYQLTASVSGLNVAAQKIADWIHQMKAASAKDRNALILTFHYEK